MLLAQALFRNSGQNLFPFGKRQVPHRTYDTELLFTLKFSIKHEPITSQTCGRIACIAVYAPFSRNNKWSLKKKEEKGAYTVQ